jgi:hypothetical protein
LWTAVLWRKQWLAWRQERSGSGLSVLPLGAAPDRRSFRRPDSPSTSVCLTSRLSSHSPTCRWVDWRRPKLFPPSVPSGQTRLPNSEAPLMFVPCPFVRAPTAVSGREILDSTMQRTITRLGADQRAACLGRGSQGFDALDTMRLHHWRVDLTSWPRMSRRPHDETLVQML